MADVTRHAKTTALLLQDLQHERIKGSRPVVPLSGAELIANCQRLLAKARAVGGGVPTVLFYDSRPGNMQALTAQSPDNRDHAR